MAKHKWKTVIFHGRQRNSSLEEWRPDHPENLRPPARPHPCGTINRK
jgi:hypothetical protein